MTRTAPTPLDINWICKPAESARSGVEILGDGRIHCWIEHEVVHGVTPKMLVWWFSHLEGDMLYEDEWLSRYRVWHPRDHVAIEYARRNADGSAGVGSIILPEQPDRRSEGSNRPADQSSCPPVPFRRAPWPCVDQTQHRSSGLCSDR